MLITFKSKAAADIIMLDAHAKRLLDPLGKDVNRGIITAGETSQAIARLEAEIAADEARRAAQQAEADAQNQDDGGDAPPAAAEPVRLATRAYPLLDMLRAAQRDGRDIVWGV